MPGQQQGNAVGVNYGTVQAFFGAQPPTEAKELLDSYLGSLRAAHERLRLGKEQTGREQRAVPALSLRAVYIALATDSSVALEPFSGLDRREILQAMDAGDPAQVLPDQVRLPVLPPPAVPGEPPAPPPRPPAITDWADLHRAVAQVPFNAWVDPHQVDAQAPFTALDGQWYRPELVVQAVGKQRRLVLLGSPGAGKSTALRYLTVALAEALLSGHASATPRPVPFFCQLGRVAQRLPAAGTPEQDVDALVDALLAPVVGAGGLRADLRATIFQAWRRGNALLCLDGLDEVAGVATGDGPIPRERVAVAIRRLAVDLAQARIVVTCRTQPYQQDAAWQLRDGWTPRVIAPLTFG